jgi:hypothetical protein
MRASPIPSTYRMHCHTLLFILYHLPHARRKMGFGARIRVESSGDATVFSAARPTLQPLVIRLRHRGRAPLSSSVSAPLSRYCTDLPRRLRTCVQIGCETHPAPHVTGTGCFSGEQSGRSARLSSHFHLAARYTVLELKLHSPIRLYGKPSNYLHTNETRKNAVF